MQLHELLCPDYFPDWNDDSNKYYVYYIYNHGCDCFAYTYCNTTSTFQVYFTKKAAEKACKILNQEKFMAKIKEAKVNSSEKSLPVRIGSVAPFIHTIEL